MSDLLLKATNLHKSFAGPNGSPVQAVEGVDLEARKGEFIALRGPSGCGKSTLLFVAGGLLRPEEGIVEIDGENLYDQDAAKRASIRANHLGFVFQQFHLVPYLDALDNVLAPTLARSISNAEEKANSLLDRFGLSNRRRHVPATLSVGEQQRVALARALLLEPKLLLADEPTGNLDPENAESILSHLATFSKEGGAVLMVTHDDRAAQRASRSIHMVGGTPESIKSIS
jgi:putative ABC transport system ATP-binding protein